jgi:starch synthase
VRVLQVSAELFPWVKTGGLADVAAALPPALQQQGVDVRLLLPGFPAFVAALAEAEDVAPVAYPWGGGSALLQRGRLGPHAVYLLRDASFDRAGNPYQDASGQPYADNARRFALLGAAAEQLALGKDGWQPHIVHGHDWHAGWAMARVALAQGPGRPRVRTVFTVHNLAYQGLFPAAQFQGLGLPATAFALQGVEFFGQLSFMKAGLHYADWLSTVSPSYAREIQTPEQGCGLDGLLRHRAAQLTGILNGVDAEVWSPGHDAALAAPYSAEDPSGKTACKAALQQESGLAVRKKTPLFAVVSRLTEQKGLPLVLANVDWLVAQGAQLLVLGSGEPALEQGFAEAAARHPGSVALRQGFDEALAHRIFAGADAVLVPSRFEPCGLTQLYGLAYGALPVVRRVGGLADTVTDCTLEDLHEGSATGFVFDALSPEGLQRALRRALALWAKPAVWREVQQRGMGQRWSWAEPAALYAALYGQLLQAVAAS